MKTGTGRNLTMLCGDKSIYHAQTHTYTITPEYEEWETKDTTGPNHELKKVAFSASVDGLACIREASDTSVNALDTPDMIATALRGETVDVVVKLAIDGTTPKDYAVKCVIDSFEVSEQVGAKATYKASLKGFGMQEMPSTPASQKASSTPASGSTK